MLALFHLCCISLTPRVALVVGGTRGIGKGVSGSFASKGVDLLLVHRSDVTSAKDTCTEMMRRYQRRVLTLCTDISEPGAMTRVFEVLDDEFLDTHQLISSVQCTGGGMDPIVTQRTPTPPGYTTQPRYWAHSAVADTRGAFATALAVHGDVFLTMCHHSLERMDKGGSLAAVVPSNKGGIDREQKWATVALGLTRYVMVQAAREGVSKGVNCNIILTRPWGPESRKCFDVGASMGVPTPSHVGEVVAFLASPRGRMITGTVLPVDGGLHLDPRDGDDDIM